MLQLLLPGQALIENLAEAVTTHKMACNYLLYKTRPTQSYRLQKAASLLSSGIDITAVVYKVGFSSPSYFSQCFKEQYGITPSDYVLKHG
ncbi:MAG TPA: helix-turn-helix domain-containing protein [Chitinophagaceae bacterium]|nr:helix-turn-helix domain-containing protein [Chitinophagaceae bacterium]